MDHYNVSVVIPSYNHSRYITQAVESALEQTAPCFEIVIVEDGSTDESPKICHELQERYPLIRLFMQDNKGAHNAINRGISEAKGDVIAVLNSDDIFFPHKIERCLTILKDNPESAFVCGKIEFIDAKGVVQNSGIGVDWLKRALNFYKRSVNYRCRF